MLKFFLSISVLCIRAVLKKPVFGDTFLVLYNQLVVHVNLFIAKIESANLLSFTTCYFMDVLIFKCQFRYNKWYIMHM